MSSRGPLIVIDFRKGGRVEVIPPEDVERQDRLLREASEFVRRLNPKTTGSAPPPPDYD
jgi:hypothetical protein